MIPRSIWEPAQEYRARIGGITYRNVLRPVVADGEPIMQIERNTESGQLAPTFSLRSGDGQAIAKIEHGSVSSLNEEIFTTMVGSWGFAVVEKANGRVWCDVRNETGSGRAYELDCSCILFDKSGCPIFLHPDRTLIGMANQNTPPNFASFSVVVETSGGDGAAIVIQQPFYATGLRLENWGTGLRVEIQ